MHLNIIIGLCAIASVTAPSPFAKHYYGFNRFLNPPTAFSAFGPYGPFGNGGIEFASSSIKQPSFVNPAPAPAPSPLVQPVKKRDVFDVVFEWNILDFVFESPEQRQEYLESQ